MGYDGFQPQTMSCHGGSNDQGSLPEEFLMQPERGLECVGGGGSYYAGAVDETQALGAQIPPERTEAGAGQEMAAITEVKSSVSMDVEKSEEVSVSTDEEEIDLNIESTNVDDFDNRPLK
ncbi:uncharacterized protein [Lolium perenne]|uniref:uncharacterized protein isoform X1 n=1 Tax=Lolium perenne TaxID=4522 RepID=UPI0021F5B540|nr:uncharacterized protein LOC127345034 [Lolium perenne]